MDMLHTGIEASVTVLIVVLVMGFFADKWNIL